MTIIIDTHYTAVCLTKKTSVAEPEPPGATIFWAAPEPVPEPIFIGRSQEPEPRDGANFLRCLWLYLFRKQKRKALFFY